MITVPGSELSFVARTVLGGPEPEIGGCLDWERVQHLAARHRVEGLVAGYLARRDSRQVPPPVLAQFEAARRPLAVHYLLQLAETLRLSTLLVKAGIPVIVLKGCAVAHQLYQPSPELRHSIDIDLLVSTDDFAEAERLLSREGYVRTTPAKELSPSAESMVCYLVSAYEYLHVDTGLKLELHHRPLGDPFTMQVPFAELLARSALVPIGGGAVRALVGETLAVHLCAHAAAHRFFRLKWLADCLRSLDALSAESLAHVLDLAREWQCEKGVLLTLLLGEWLRRTSAEYLLDDEHRTRLAPLLGHAARAIEEDEKTGHKIADIPDDLRNLSYAVRLASTPHSRLFAGLRLLTHPDDTAALGLSARWAPVYALLGRILAIGRLVARWRQRRRTVST